jgi:adenylate cyclase
MPYEIERKFLVRDDSWRASARAPLSIRQGYLTCNGSLSIRIRVIDQIRARLTIKSAVSKISRLEFEYEIPIGDAAVLLSLRECGLVEKLRYRLPWHDLTWDIDVFQGENQGLVIAEIELPDEDKAFEKPDWLGPEVTSAPRYSNTNLAKMSFGSWPEDWRCVRLIEPGTGNLDFNAARRRRM